MDPNSPAADPFLSPVRYVARPNPAPRPQVTRQATRDRRGSDILVYRDRQGVLHIKNWEAAGPPEKSGPPLLDGQGQVAALRSVSQEEMLPAPPQPGRQPSLQQAAWPAQPSRPRPPQVGQAPENLARSEPETIRRYRDTRGVLHVTNEGAPGSANGSPAGWAGGRGVTPASYPSGIREGPGPPQDSRPPPGANKVVAGRDHQGRLIIRTINPETMPAGGTPPQTLAGLEPIIVEASQRYGLPVPLILAVIKVESNFVSKAVSPKGAMGLMQLMPGTADSLGVKDPFCPRENVMAGCRYLRQLLNTLNGSLPLGLAAYNAGFQRVINAGFRIPDIKETQNFVTQVLERYQESAPRGP